jgi:hypothetical protein
LAQPFEATIEAFKMIEPPDDFAAAFGKVLCASVR